MNVCGNIYPVVGGTFDTCCREHGHDGACGYEWRMFVSNTSRPRPSC